MKRGLTVAALTAVAFSALAVGGSAALSPGDLDPGFGTGGIVTTDFEGADNFGLALAVQPDGKLIVGGNACAAAGSTQPGCDFALARYDARGELDPTFGSDGRVRTDLGSTMDTVFGLALQPDGKIVAVGSGPGSGVMPESAVVRYSADGSLDPTFGSGGMRLRDVPWQASAVAVQANGRLLVGYSSGVTRYLPDGTLDPSFGIGGTAAADTGASAVAVLPDGKILVGGFDGLARYLPDGTLDTSFGAGGRVATYVYSGALALQPDGKIVTASGAWGGADFKVSRFLPDGSPDLGFGSDGTVTTDVGSNADHVWDVAVQRDGKIVAAGSSAPADPVNPGVRTSDFALARYLPGGTLDVGFGSGGIVTTDINGRLEYGASVAVQADGDIVVAGSTYLAPGSSSDFALARYASFVDFRSLEAGVLLVLPRLEGRDTCTLAARFALGEESDGISPLREPLRLALGGRTLIIPAGSFTAIWSGWRFSGTIDGSPWTVTIHRLPAGSYLLTARGDHLDWSTVSATLDVHIRIGDDGGTAPVAPVVFEY
jgi:uncharacterized delta-60 repeat protein